MIKMIRPEAAYDEMVRGKAIQTKHTSIPHRSPIHSSLFPFQRRIVEWCLERGRAALFADCGMGKTLMQLEWSRQVGGKVMILTPLAVAAQTCAEASKFGIDATVSRDGVAGDGITITNYESLHKFDCSIFDGVVLDESSILKSYDGKTRNAIIESFQLTPYKLACTATPAPNDHMELGNHSEFLGAMTRSEMLSTFFVHDAGATQKWRVKGHARDDFWRWCSTWAVMCRLPSDVGPFCDDGYSLPPMDITDHNVETSYQVDGSLFPEAATLQEHRSARRASIAERVQALATLVNDSDEPWVVWCELNDESSMLASLIDGATEVTGSQSDDEKADRLAKFASGDARVIVTKPKIAGFGMNWQHCSNVAFVGVSHSFEQFYQAIRRCWRFGQTSAVAVHLFTSTAEQATVRSIRRKQQQANQQRDEMVKHMGSMASDGALTNSSDRYEEIDVDGEGFTLMRGDCVKRCGSMDSDSIDYSIFSPPFSSLYTYSASAYDMGNVASHSQFIEQFRFLIDELLRVTKPGRLLSFHCANIMTTKGRDGVIGMVDFRGMLISAFVDAGWVYHSEVCIWKDPVIAMQRTKAIGLLYKQLRKDSAMSRQGLPDYLVTMRKPGDNPSPVEKTHSSFPVDVWQKFASPVWMDINQSDTLQRESARSDQDERHICPRQLGVIRRALALWTNEGDTVLSPFAGIGSEGVVSLEMGRSFVGIELKHSYFNQAAMNLKRAKSTQMDLFAM